MNIENMNTCEAIITIELSTNKIRAQKYQHRGCRMNNILRALGWAILLSACLYFSYGALYYLGYNHGYASKVCDRLACFEQIVKYSK